MMVASAHDSEAALQGISMNFNPTNIAALVIAASFAAGLNLYATVATLGLVAHTNWVALPPGLEVLGSWWIIGVCAILFAIEFVADKIPAFDLVWNAMHTFVRVPVAALVAYRSTTQLSPQMQILATAAGAAIALIAHTSKTAARGAVTPSPEPVSNIALSTSEDALAIGLTWLATKHPAAAIGAASTLIVLSVLAIHWLLKAIRIFIQQIRNVFAPS
jgi:hypothetical protein